MTIALTALLGRKDLPTDAVEEYCEYLGEALRLHGFALKVARVSWSEQGWANALRELRRQSASWRGQWVFVQYNALAWSSRGFPLRLRKVLKVLRQSGARIGVVFHDVEPYGGSRLIDKLRRAAQLHTMRAALRFADLSVFTIPMDKISWLQKATANTAFIPVGANLPPTSPAATNQPSAPGGRLRVAVFGITGGATGLRESAEIVHAVRAAAAKTPALQLFAFGRHADDRGSLLREGLRDLPVDVLVEGVLPASRVAQELSSSDVLLFVRGQISSRRGSAIAGIACGLPVIAYPGPETAPPITEAGVVLVSQADPAELGAALTRVFTDQAYRASLAARSVAAQQKYFSWKAIASRYAEELRRHDSSNSA
ncbi:MAG: glycosyltransferase family 4 protein [Candidatus Acidiferrum sp.]